MGNRDASLELLLPRVAIRRVTLAPSQCPVIKGRVNALRKISITIPRRDIIRIHGVQHRILVDLPGARIDATLDDPESPLVKWAMTTSNVLRGCMTE
jgi:hypothetical protein